MMKRVLLSVIATAALAAFVTTSAQAAAFSFQTILSSAGEPVPTSLATGAAVVNFDDVANTITVLVSWSGLASSTPFGHIHCCTATPGIGNSGVQLNFTGLTQATTGSWIGFFQAGSPAYAGGATFASLLAGANAGRAYVNIHTPGLYAGGEIRGFLPAIPEPGTYALMLAGLGAVAFIARRRKV